MPSRHRNPAKRGRNKSAARDSAQGELALPALDTAIQKCLAAELSGDTLGRHTEGDASSDAPTSAAALIEQQEAAAPAALIPQSDLPPLPVRRLHNFVYCPRLFYYQWVENLFEENADTIEGSAVHRQIDKPSQIVESDPRELDLPEGARLRSLQLESDALGIVGKIDVVEGAGEGLEIIDHKKGSARRDSNGDRVPKEADAIQIAAYALLLAEHGHNVRSASIYYASERRRVAVPLNETLLNECRRYIAEAKAVAVAGVMPPPLRDDPRCLHCSAYPICLPNESAFWRVPHGTPPQIKEPPRPKGNDGEVIVVQKSGCIVGQRGGEIIVSEKKAELQKFPLHQVRAVYLYGAVQVSAQAAHSFLEHGIDVAYFSPAGRFLGLLRGLPASGVDARLGQYRLFGERGIRLRLTREIIRAKVHNQRVMLMRNGDVPAAVLRRLACLRDQTAEAADLDSLRGIEGTAAAVYFEQFGTMLAERDWRFTLTERNRRPPRDPVNALLSLGYSVLCKELTGVCHAVGLDPFLGFYHQPRYGRPALALDLMEEFRPLIADSVAISLLNRGELGPQDFVRSASGCFLKENGRRAFWESWFRRLDGEVTHPQFGYVMSYRRMLDVQARQLWRFVRGEAEQYIGFTTR
jgi:CRISP-associated protein Cas1